VRSGLANEAARPARRDQTLAVVVVAVGGEQDCEDRLLATVFLGSGLRFVAMLFVAAGVGALLVVVTFQEVPVPSVENACLPDVFA
jgi:hypothetical protein